MKWHFCNLQFTAWLFFCPHPLCCLLYPELRADSRLAPSQWETLLQSNAVSHWLGANLESALWAVFIMLPNLTPILWSFVIITHLLWSFVIITHLLCVCCFLTGNIDQVQYCDKIKNIVDFLGASLSQEELAKIWKMQVWFQSLVCTW